MDRPLIIGITGSIASGKSEVVKELQATGYKVYSTDIIGHEVLLSEEVKASLVNKFGKDILDIDNKTINREKLSKLVFKDKDNLAFLNSISHPLIFKRMRELVTVTCGNYLFFEVPLLFETSLEQHFDYIITVSASPDKQLFRLMKRNNQTREEAIRKITSQLSNTIKEKKADFVIMNNGDLDDLHSKTAELITKLPTINPKNIISF